MQKLKMIKSSLDLTSKNISMRSSHKKTKMFGVMMKKERICYNYITTLRTRKCLKVYSLHYLLRSLTLGIKLNIYDEDLFREYLAIP